MIEIKRRLTLRLADESGFSIVEVLVALIVFSILSVGIAFTLLNSLVLTKEARSREVAIHLASQEVDKIRSLEDIFDVVSDSSKTYTVDGTTYQIIRKAQWDNSAGDAMQCGDLASGSGSFEFKRVEVSIDWTGRREGSQPVYTDTIISPNRRITDPTLATVLVSVINASGAGVQGISVNAAPNGGGAETPPESIPLTDVEGCSYVLKVTPGKYIITASKNGYVDVAQNINQTSSTVTVAAGELKSVQFQFDEGATFAPDYAAGFPTTVELPNDTPATALSTYGDFNISGSSFLLHPFLSGYGFMAGTYVAPSMANGGCLSPNPALWPPALADGAIGVPSDTYTALSGSAVSVPIEMGVVGIYVNSTRQVRAVSVASNAANGDPGCALGYTVTFPNQPKGFVDLALPFGTWQIQVKPTSSGSWSTLKESGTHRLDAVRTRGLIDGQNVLLDPRKVP